MGDFRITIDAVGGHGCQREIKDGGHVNPCGQPSCPDCQARAFVEQLKATGTNVRQATLEHWPAKMLNYETPPVLVDRTEGVGPVDDLLTGVRTGSF